MKVCNLKGLGALVLMILVILVFCGFKSNKNVAELKKVKIGCNRLRVSLPLFVAQEQGIFRKNGLNVELVMFDTAQPLMDALCAGHLNAAGYTAFPITFSAQMRSKKQLYYATALVEDDEHPISMLMVKKDSRINGIADLRGKRIGILPTFAYRAWLDMILKENNISNKEVVVQMIAPALTPAALASGSVDAMFTNDPAITTTVQKGIGRVLYNGAIVPKYLWSPLPFGSFNLSKEFVDNNPDTAQRIVKSLDEAIAIINKDPNKAKKMMANYLPEAERPFVHHYPDSLYQNSREVSRKDFERLADSYLKEGIIKERLDVKGLVYDYKPRGE